MLKPGWDASSEVTKLGGKLGRRLGLINGQVARAVERAAPEARRPSRRRAHHLGPSDRRRDEPRGGHGRRARRAGRLWATRRGHRRRGHRLGRHLLARRPRRITGASSLVQTMNGQRVADVRRLRQRPHDAVRRQRPRHARRRHHRRQRLRLARRARRHRARGAPGQPEGARRERPRRHQQRHRGARLGGREQGGSTTSASSTCRLARRSPSPTTTDPLTLAAKRAVDAGIVVVTAAGNLGKNARGQTQYGGITAPGNAPWVLTVGASSHEGTVNRADDMMARLQLARPDGHRLRGEAGPRRAGHGHRVAERPGAACSTSTKAAVPAEGLARARLPSRT